MQTFGIPGYFKQRFPLAGVFFLALVTAFTSAALYQGPPDTAALLTTLLVAVSFSALLLRQRVIDEFKDKSHDAKNFPDRPFSKGLISAKTLIALGVIALIVELTAVYYAGGILSLYWYLPVLIYSLFMAKEFFISKWLERHFSLYFILHEIIFIFYGAWLVYITGRPLTVQTILWIFYFTCLLMAVEIGRKFKIRKDTKNKIVRDTYTAVWGRASTIAIIGLLVMTAGICLSVVMSSLIFATIAAITTLCLYLPKLKDVHIQAILILYSITIVGLGAIL